MTKRNVVGTRKPSWKGWRAFNDWTAVEIDISRGKFPDLPTIAKALRGSTTVPPIVRVFFAQLIERKRVKYPGKGRRAPDVFTQEMNARFLVETYEDERERAEGGWTPKGTSRLDHFLPGTPAEVAVIRTAIAAAEKGIVGHKGKPLKADAMRKRLTEARAFLRRR